MDTFEIFIHKWYEKQNALCTETEIDEARNNYDLCLRLYHEITEEPKAIIRIDSRDFESFFSDSNVVNAYECSIDGRDTQRMAKLVNIIKEKIGYSQCPCKLLLYLFAPDKNDLLMSEMEAVNDWLNESFNNKEIRFGLGINENSNEMRLAVMIQYNSIQDSNED